MHMSDDLVIVEPVDEDGKPVPSGVGASKVYLTRLYNHTLPLIRYEVTDKITFFDEPCPCGSVYSRIEDVEGRLDETFDYRAGRHVNPHIFRSVLGSEGNIVEYQVRQTSSGASISIRCSGPVEEGGLRSKLEHGLREQSLEDAAVSIVKVDHIYRLATGKLKRFVPMASTGS